jgi:hypothetical protein
VYKIGAIGIQFVKIMMFQQSELLEHHEALRPWTRFKHGPTTKSVRNRPFYRRAPAHQVGTAQKASTGSSRLKIIDDFLPTKTINGLAYETRSYQITSGLNKVAALGGYGSRF